jgi:lysyl-tRNA synthetase class 2
VLEVDTPHLSAFANSDPQIESLAVHWQEPGGAPRQGWLHTSPEFPMKRLLASGSGSIYQICKVFRAGERGRLHNPEFTLVEWYRLHLDHQALIHEIAQLINQLLPTPRPSERISYQQLFLDHLNIDPLQADAPQLRQLARQQGIPGIDALEMERDDWLDLLFSYQIQPQLGQDSLCFVHAYPASQASLAQLDPQDPRTAHRFELFINGMELANGFHELQDPTEQANRFQQDLHKRKERGQTATPPDPHLLQALHQGLPHCAGVALGLERLQMAITNADHIDQVIAFPSERA